MENKQQLMLFGLPCIERNFDAIIRQFEKYEARNTAELSRYKQALDVCKKHLEGRGYGDNYVYACVNTLQKINEILAKE